MEKPVKMCPPSSRQDGAESRRVMGEIPDHRQKQVLFSPLRRAGDDKLSWKHTPDRRKQQVETPYRRRNDDVVERDGS